MGVAATRTVSAVAPGGRVAATVGSSTAARCRRRSGRGAWTRGWPLDTSTMARARPSATSSAPERWSAGLEQRRVVHAASALGRGEPGVPGGAEAAAVRGQRRERRPRPVRARARSAPCWSLRRRHVGVAGDHPQPAGRVLRGGERRLDLVGVARRRRRPCTRLRVSAARDEDDREDCAAPEHARPEYPPSARDQRGPEPADAEAQNMHQRAGSAAVLHCPRRAMTLPVM